MPKRYREARLMNKIKLTDMAEKLSVSQPTLSAWEAERKAAPVEAIIKMADFYGVTVDYLLGREDVMVPSPQEPIAQTILMHPIEPVFDKNSEILILGSFPSVRSRQQKFFYGHPQNRFWRVLAAVFESALPQSVDEKKKFLKARHIALWDVIESCEITGSSDPSIKNAVANDLGRILSCAKIRCIFLNGKTAQRYYDRFFGGKISVGTVCLPSTSPANATWSIERLAHEWKCLKDA